jgi:uncharacterized pyridoxamine 5'-phosphate oxidase family protein
MTQLLSTSYHEQDTSTLHNKRFVNVIRPGVYSGYYVRPNVANAAALDITHGNDTTSVLVTSEGVRIEETAISLGVVLIEPANPNLTRIDLLVAEYRFTTNNAVKQVYKIIKGVNQITLTTAPVKPLPSAYQIPLAYITVRPQVTFKGAIKVQILITDIEPVLSARYTTAPDQLASLKPEICAADTRRIYVNPGMMSNADGTRAISFAGAYSDVLDGSLSPVNSTAYYLFGITDAGKVVLVGSATALDELPNLSVDSLPVAIVTGVETSGQIRFTALTDIRFPFQRHLSKQDVEDQYKALLSGSVFRDLRIERFLDDTSVDLTSVALQNSGANASLTAEIDSKNGALALIWAGTTSVPTEDVTISTGNLLENGIVGRVKHFLLAIDSPYDLRFQYSTTSATSGFGSSIYEPNAIVRIPASGSTKLYIKLIIPSGAFVNAATARIFSMGLLLNLSTGAFNVLSIDELGLSSISKSSRNLLANGNFYRWSKNTADGLTPNLAAQSTLEFTASLDDPNLADGWQITSLGAPLSNDMVLRVIRDSETNASSTALEVTTAAAGTTIIEYRIPAVDFIGEHLTFSINYESESTQSSASIGIAQLRRTSDGLQVKTKATDTAKFSSGELVVNTNSTIGADVEQISFFIQLTSAGTDTNRFFAARAGVGRYSQLPFTSAPDAVQLKQYYERGRLFSSYDVVEGTAVGASVQFGASKLIEMGSVIARTIPGSSVDRSTNVDELVYDADSSGLVVSAQATGTGAATIDVIWEAFVKYEGSV